MRIQITDKEKKIKDLFDRRIKKIKGRELKAQRLGKKSEAARARAEFYSVLTLKDIWLRKFMYALGLYLKETPRSPATSMLGGMGQR